MTYKEILVLLSAGYTKEEIDKMNDSGVPGDSPFSSPPSPPSPPVEADPTPRETGAAGEGEQAPEAVENITGGQLANVQNITIEQIESVVSKLIAGIQANNRADAEMGAKIIDPHKTALDTLRSISDIPTQN